MTTNNRYPLYFTAPPMLLYVVFFILPSLAGIVYAFTRLAQLSYSDEVNFVGFKNLIKIFTRASTTSPIFPTP